MLFRKSGQRVPILRYHSRSDRAQPRFRKYSLPPVRFAEQMSYLVQHKYATLTVSQYVMTRATGVELPESDWVLTFDDGFSVFYSEALPVLQSYGTLIVWAAHG